MDDYDWEIVTKDGRSFPVPAEKAPVVQRRWDAKQPIHFANESINYYDIERFNKTSRRPVTTPLLEGAAAAFDEPMFSDEGDMQYKWVKMQVSQREYAKHYLPSPGYKSLDNENGMVTVAFKQPIHQIDPYKTDLCTDDEVNRLT